MSGFLALTSVTQGIVRVIDAAFSEVQPLAAPARAASVGSGEMESLAQAAANGAGRVGVFLYRIDEDRTTRPVWSAVGAGDGRARLALELHYLLISFGQNADAEQRLIGRALQALEVTPTLSGALLDPLGGVPSGEPVWRETDAVHLGIENLPTEAIMRVFDTLPIKYRLSVPYTARVVRVDARPGATRPRVLDARAEAHAIGVPA